MNSAFVPTMTLCYLPNSHVYTKHDERVTARQIGCVVVRGHRNPTLVVMSGGLVYRTGFSFKDGKFKEDDSSIDDASCLNELPRLPYGRIRPPTRPLGYPKSIRDAIGQDGFFLNDQGISVSTFAIRNALGTDFPIFAHVDAVNLEIPSLTYARHAHITMVHEVTGRVQGLPAEVKATNPWERGMHPSVAGGSPTRFDLLEALGGEMKSFAVLVMQGDHSRITKSHVEGHSFLLYYHHAPKGMSTLHVRDSNGLTKAQTLEKAGVKRNRQPVEILDGFTSPRVFVETWRKLLNLTDLQVVYDAEFANTADGICAVATVFELVRAICEVENKKMPVKKNDYGGLLALVAKHLNYAENGIQQDPQSPRVLNRKQRTAAKKKADNEARALKRESDKKASVLRAAM